MVKTRGKKQDWLALTASDKAIALAALVAKDLTAAEMAGCFANCTRNAIIGFCRRQKIDLPLNHSNAATYDATVARRNAAHKRARESAGLPLQIKTPEDAAPLIRPQAEPPMIAAQPPVVERFEPDIIFSLEASLFVPKPVTYMEAIESKTACKWPLWDTFDGPLTSMCCGGPRLKGGPYCKKHDRLGKGPGTYSERQAVHSLMSAVKASNKSGVGV